MTTTLIDAPASLRASHSRGPVKPLLGFDDRCISPQIQVGGTSFYGRACQTFIHHIGGCTDCARYSPHGCNRGLVARRVEVDPFPFSSINL